jgi:hypothetical protein
MFIGSASISVVFLNLCGRLRERTQRHGPEANHAEHLPTPPGRALAGGLYLRVACAGDQASRLHRRPLASGASADHVTYAGSAAIIPSVAAAVLCMKPHRLLTAHQKSRAGAELLRACMLPLYPT